jgi:Rod binding domain-containing protein
MNPLTALTSLNAAHGATASNPANAPSAARPAEPTPTPEMMQVARDFEAVFLRAMLAPLEKATKMGGASSMQAGQSAYGGMVVGAMADSMTSAGGIGLAEVVAKAMAQQQSAGKKAPDQP